MEKPNKDNTLLHIILCNFPNGIKMNFLDKKKDIYPKEYAHKFYGWKFYDYGNSSDERKIKDIVEKIKDLSSKKEYQIVLVINDNYKNDANNHSLLIMKEIIMNLNDILFHPLIIYVSHSINKKTQYYRNILKQYILEIRNNEEEGDEYDTLNISSFLYQDRTFTNKLIDELWQCTIYYNQLPTMYLPMSENDERFELKVKKYPFALNILLAGENGVGKSSFINLLSNRKIAYESDNGLLKTNKINEYMISYKESEINDVINNNISQEDRIFNYKIIDTKGFSFDNKELDELIEKIEEYNNEQTRIKDRIHCVLYFLNENHYTRIFSNVIKKFFENIYNKRIKIIFVINFNNGNNHICKNKLKKNFKLAFDKNQYKFFFEENDRNIIEVNLKGIRPFGMGKIMEKLETFFQQYKINLNNIPNNNNSYQEVLNYIQKYQLYDDLKNKEDLCIKFIARAKKLISYTLPITIGISFLPIPGVDDALAISIESGLITAIAHSFGEKISSDSLIRIFYDLNLPSGKRIALLIGKVVLRITGVAVDILKLLPVIGTIIGGALSCGVNVLSLEATGHQAIEYFTERFMNDLTPEKIIKMCKEYNDDIDGLSKLKELFNFSEKK